MQNCPADTYYWPEEKGCFSNYNCASSLMLDDKNPCQGFSNQNIHDKSSTDCSKYLYCDRKYVYFDGDSVGLLLARSVSCPSGTLYSPADGCVDASSYQCVNYPCTTEGSFVDPNANSCLTFIRCVKMTSWQGSTNTYLYADLITCPSGTKFSPFTKKCDFSYNCDGVDQYSGADPCAEFNRANPFVPNPLETQAESYIQCNKVAHSTINILKKDCPENSFFSPLLGKCYNNYVPNETCSKDPCSSGSGKYVDIKSVTCENFVKCRDMSENASYYQPIYEKLYCPTGTFYSPELKACSKHYACPASFVDYCYPQIPTTTSTTTTTSAPQG